MSSIQVMAFRRTIFPLSLILTIRQTLKIPAWEAVWDWPSSNALWRPTVAKLLSRASWGREAAFRFGCRLASKVPMKTSSGNVWRNGYFVLVFSTHAPLTPLPLPTHGKKGGDLERDRDQGSRCAPPWLQILRP